MNFFNEDQGKIIKVNFRKNGEIVHSSEYNNMFQAFAAMRNWELLKTEIEEYSSTVFVQKKDSNNDTSQSISQSNFSSRGTYEIERN